MTEFQQLRERLIETALNAEAQVPPWVRGARNTVDALWPIIEADRKRLLDEVGRLKALEIELREEVSWRMNLQRQLDRRLGVAAEQGAENARLRKATEQTIEVLEVFKEGNNSDPFFDMLGWWVNWGEDALDNLKALRDGEAFPDPWHHHQRCQFRLGKGSCTCLTDEALRDGGE
jgi:hypothetical protein